MGTGSGSCRFGPGGIGSGAIGPGSPVLRGVRPESIDSGPYWRARIRSSQIRLSQIPQKKAATILL